MTFSAARTPFVSLPYSLPPKVTTGDLRPTCNELQVLPIQTRPASSDIAQEHGNQTHWVAGLIICAKEVLYPGRSTARGIFPPGGSL